MHLQLSKKREKSATMGVQLLPIAYSPFPVLAQGLLCLTARCCEQQALLIEQTLARKVNPISLGISDRISWEGVGLGFVWGGN